MEKQIKSTNKAKKANIIDEKMQSDSYLLFVEDLIEQPKKDCSINIHGKPVTFSKSDLTKISKGICQIIFIKEGYEYGSGFFLKISAKMKILVTNNHVIGQTEIDNKTAIKIIFQEKEQYLVLDTKERQIGTISKDTYDITFIQIIQKDNIPDDSFLELDNNIGKNSNYINEKIIILQHPKGRELMCSCGIIIGKDDEFDFRFKHDSSTKKGSSGSPVISLESMKVIGLHKGTPEGKNYNIAVFLKELINKFFGKKEIINQNDVIIKKILLNRMYSLIY